MHVTLPPPADRDMVRRSLRVSHRTCEWPCTSGCKGMLQPVLDLPLGEEGPRRRGGAGDTPLGPRFKTAECREEREGLRAPTWVVF